MSNILLIISYTLKNSNVGRYINLPLEKLILKSNELAKLFGRNIKAARAKRDINQERLCELADIDRSYLSRIENGNCKVALEKVYEIALALDCSLTDILPELNEVKNK